MSHKIEIEDINLKEKTLVERHFVDWRDSFKLEVGSYLSTDVDGFFKKGDILELGFEDSSPQAYVLRKRPMTTVEYKKYSLECLDSNIQRSCKTLDHFKSRLETHPSLKSHSLERIAFYEEHIKKLNEKKEKLLNSD